MHLAYIDESGSTGQRSSMTYTLGCVLIEASRWPGALDDLIRFRRFLKREFKLPVRAEVKANYLLRNGGPFRVLALSEESRFRIYRGFMRIQPKIGLVTFATVVRKDVMAQKGLTSNPRDEAWTMMIQRLERFTTKGSTHVMIFHDEGDGDYIRGAVRKARRIGTAGKKYGEGSLSRPAKLLLDDPVPKRSAESYFIQLADLNAYAAFRRLYPPPQRPVQIVPQSMWDELGDARFAKSNELSGGPRGIPSFP